MASLAGKVPLFIYKDDGVDRSPVDTTASDRVLNDDQSNPHPSEGDTERRERNHLVLGHTDETTIPLSNTGG